MRPNSMRIRRLPLTSISCLATRPTVLHRPSPSFIRVVSPTPVQRHSSTSSLGRRFNVRIISTAVVAVTVIFALPQVVPTDEHLGGKASTETFAPFTIVSKEPISSTSSIFTLRPAQTKKHNGELYENAWKRGIWSVDFKQPHMQIARAYTPIPTLNPKNGQDLNFLIRREKEGEVSGYLHSLGTGSTVDLRGPHVELELPSTTDRVIFIAGGTGIAPALQTAQCLFEARQQDRPIQLHILWANRRREDCIGGNEVTPSKTRGAIVTQLETLKDKHRGKITVDYFVDEEKSYIRDEAITRLLRQSTIGVSKDQPPNPSNNLILVSGPDGFIEHYAGPKLWVDGQQRQGPLKGLLGRMHLRGWTVWKL